MECLDKYHGDWNFLKMRNILMLATVCVCSTAEQERAELSGVIVVD